MNIKKKIAPLLVLRIHAFVQQGLIEVLVSKIVDSKDKKGPITLDLMMMKNVRRIANFVVSIRDLLLITYYHGTRSILWHEVVVVVVVAIVVVAASSNK